MKRDKLIKIIVTLLLSITILFSLTVPTLAANNGDNTVSPRWTSIFTMDVEMAFVGTQGNTTGTARKQSTADYIIGTLYLFKWNGSNYEYMDEASGRATVGTLGLSIDFVAERGVQYKATLVVIAYTGDEGEYENISYYKTCK